MKVLALLLAVTRNPKSGMVNGSKLVVIFAILLLFQTTLVQASPLQTAETRRLQANAPCPAGTVNAYSDDHLTFRFQSDGITNQSGSLRWNAAVPANLGLAFTMTRPEDEQAYITFSPTRSTTAPVPGMCRMCVVWSVCRFCVLAPAASCGSFAVLSSLILTVCFAFSCFSRLRSLTGVWSVNVHRLQPVARRLRRTDCR